MVNEKFFGGSLLEDRCLFYVREQQVEEKAVSASRRQEIDRLWRRIVAGELSDSAGGCGLLLGQCANLTRSTIHLKTLRHSTPHCFPLC